MLIKAKTLKGYKLHGRDGEIGKTKEFYFDDQYWTIRYLIADTGGWLADKQVLISPYALQTVDTALERIGVDLTMKQIEGSPPLDTDKPVSRQFEGDYYGYYQWPVYWEGPYMWGSNRRLARNSAQWRKSTPGEMAWDPHLRSTAAVTGNHIQATDGEIGHVEDFIVDDESWAIRYLVVATKNWWPGKKVLVAPQWIDRISWSQSKVFLKTSRETVQTSPEYSEEALLTREYETGLHVHYGRPGYWVDKPEAEVIAF